MPFAAQIVFPSVTETTAVAIAETLDLRHIALTWRTGRVRRLPSPPATKTKIAWLRRVGPVASRAGRAASSPTKRPGRRAELWSDRRRDRPASIVALGSSRWPWLGRSRCARDPIGEVIEVDDASERTGSAQGPRAARRRLLHLRIASERDRRRGGRLRQERQRSHSARRQGSVSFEPGDRRSLPKRPTKSGLPEDAVQLVETTDRDAVGHC